MKKPQMCLSQTASELRIPDFTTW